MDEERFHLPVMADEIVGLFSAIPAGVVADATVGGGGHASLLLQARADVSLVGIDRDPEAIRVAEETLRRFEDRVQLVHATFDRLPEVLDELLPGAWLSGALFDLGVSSYQLDEPTRGFSYRQGGPLDMRMDPTQGPTAAELLDAMDEPQFVALLAENGEARFARRIARAVLAARPIRTTDQLADLVAGAIPAAARRRGHPARRVFQALRIAVNEELQQLGPTLDATVSLLAPGGRLVVLSYHSGEDRIVKERFLQAETGGCTCPPGLPCVCGAIPLARRLTRGARMASEAEVAANPRARGVRLRAIERLSQSGDR